MTGEKAECVGGAVNGSQRVQSFLINGPPRQTFTYLNKPPSKIYFSIVYFFTFYHSFSYHTELKSIRKCF